MATNNKKNNTKRGKTASSKKQGETLSVNDFLNGFSKWELVSFCIGFLLVAFSIYSLAAFVSYVITGAQDFDLLEQNIDLNNVNNQYANVCGSWGAHLAYYFLNDLFGFASFLIPPYLIIVGMRMMRIYKFTLVRKFIMFVLLMLWMSVFFATFSDLFPIFEGTFIKLGGNHGINVENALKRVIGTPGLIFVLIIYAVGYLIYVSTKTIEVVRKVLRFEYLKDRFHFKKKDEEGSDDDDDEEDDEEERKPKNKFVSFFKKIFGKGDDEEDDDEDDDEEDEDDDEEDDDEGDNVGGNAAAATALNVASAAYPENPGSTVIDLGGDDFGVTFNGDDSGINANDNRIDFGVAEADDNPVPVIGEAPSADVSVSSTVLEVETNETEIGKGDIERGDINTPYDPKLDLEFYKYPEESLLKKADSQGPQIDMTEQNANKERIIQVLKNFGVDIVNIKATIGPTITLYEIVPVEGTRISKIRGLEDDIALSLAAEGIRIIAPIPGKGTIGIEVPNKKKCIVSMESIISSKVFRESKMELPCAVGKTISNEVFMFDLAKAPHLLVAGATGQGKSVGLNAIVTSLLYKKHPSELKIVMVDPKKVEFSIYSPIENHFLARLEEEDDCIITDVQKVVKTLNSLCALMDSRYDLLKKAHVRNIVEYNEKFKNRLLNPEHGHEFMPYVVVIVDEFGDLIMTAGKEVELPICRIAQLARAVGIHMIIATQRPQASIISGAIKTNFPARIAFKVSSMIDSKVILDRPGANQLIGKGDMLYLQGEGPVRVQCAFVDTPEVNNICNFISQQQAYLHPMFLPEVADSDMDGGVSMGTVDKGHLDPMFSEVAKFVVNNQSGSTSMIQRNYSIGYNRAGKIMDQLEKMGVVGPQVGSKPREVLIKDPITLDSLLNTL